MAISRRDHLLDTALELFYRHGFHAVGIDRILAQSGCAKMTLYKHFRSKNELILAALRRRDERFRAWFVRAVERRATAPRERLLAIFDVLAEWFASPDFSGCMFINASAEFGDRDDPIHAAAAEHKRLMFVYVRNLARAAGVTDADDLAGELMLLKEGAIVLAHVAGDRAAARRARAAAEVLVDRDLPERPAA
jgi:AcrR family transcriptional regulator